MRIDPKHYLTSSKKFNRPRMRKLPAVLLLTLVIRECSASTCPTGFTGLACDESCLSSLTATCPSHQFETQCSPPFQRTCAACTGAIDTTLDTPVYDGTNRASATHRKHQLIDDDGDFEKLKLDSAVVTQALPAVQSAPEFTKWSDVMFSKQTWQGKGSVYVVRDVGKGVGGSNGYLKMTPGSSVVVDVDVSSVRWINNEADVTFDYRKGVAYSFSARFFSNKNQDATLTVMLRPFLPDSDNYYSKSLSFSGIKNTYESYTGLIDFRQLKGTNDLNKHMYFILSYERGVEDLIIDNLFLSPSLVDDAFFDSYAQQDVQVTDYWLVPVNDQDQKAPVWKIEETSYLIIYHNSSENSKFRYRYSLSSDITDSQDLPSATVSFFLETKVSHKKGTSLDDNPTTIIMYLTSDAGDTKLLVKQDLNVDDEVTLQGTATLTVEELQTGKLVIENTRAAPVFVDYVHLTILPDSCAVTECTRKRDYGFVNGDCRPCDVETPCEAGQRTVGCSFGLYSNEAMCEDCLATDSMKDGEWVEGEQECSYKCADGWYDRSVSECKPCSTDLSCATGQQVLECGLENDNACVACAGLDATNPGQVYLTPSVMGTCSQGCLPGYFQWNLETAQDETPLCFPCTGSVCGTEGSFRTRSGLQYTTECAADRDSTCRLCRTRDENAVVISSGGALGEWCDVHCVAGFRKCELYAFTPDRLSAHVDTFEFLGNGTVPLGEILLDYTARSILQIEGTVVFYSLQFGVEFRVCVSLIDSEVAQASNTEKCVVTETPLLPSSSTPNTHQFLAAPPEVPFKATVFARDFIPNPGVTPTHFQVTLQGSAPEPYPAEPIMHVFQTSLEVQIVPEASCDAENLDEEHILRCRKCDDATTLIPGNASYKISDDCEWECNKHYEYNAEMHECVYCRDPECPIGHVWSKCGECTPCAPLSIANAEYTGRGQLRYNNLSCPFECNTGYYLANDENSNFVCEPCSLRNCSVVSFPAFQEACTPYEDTQCVACDVCGTGEIELSPCNETSDTVCESCNVSLLPAPGPNGADPFFYEINGCDWTCPFPFVKDSINHRCIDCDPRCEVGYYEQQSCTLENHFTGCAPCTAIPSNAVPVSAGRIQGLNHSCEWECTNGTVLAPTQDACIPPPETTPPPASTLQEIAAQAPPDCASPIDGAPRCSLGYFLDTSNPSSAAPCGSCSPCPATPPDSVFKTPGDCAWSCRYPLIRIGDECKTLATGFL